MSLSVISLKELTYIPEYETSATKPPRNAPSGKKHTALVKPSMISVPDLCQSRPTGNTYHKKDQSPVTNATKKSNSITQPNRNAAARTEEDDRPKIGPHQTAGKGVAPSLLGRKNASVIHDDYCASNGPAKQKEDEEGVGMWCWYKHESGYKGCLGPAQRGWRELVVSGCRHISHARRLSSFKWDNAQNGQLVCNNTMNCNDRVHRKTCSQYERENPKSLGVDDRGLQTLINRTM